MQNTSRVVVRPCDEKFARWYAAKVERSFRVVLDGDVVTNAPPTFLGYKHVGRQCVYDGRGSLIVQPHGFELLAHLAFRTSAYLAGPEKGDFNVPSLA